MPLIATPTRLSVLPRSRVGDRPRMQRALPHVQLDQMPPADVMEKLIEHCLKIPGIRSRQGRMATPDSHALYFADAHASGPPEAFIDDHEFCHIRPLPECGIHLTLPKMLRDEVVRLGWGELHPIAAVGILTSLVTVYAPRDCEELASVFGLIVQSSQFAQGKLEALQGGEHSLREPR